MVLFSFFLKNIYTNTHKNTTLSYLTDDENYSYQEESIGFTDVSSSLIQYRQTSDKLTRQTNKQTNKHWLRLDVEKSALILSLRIYFH